MTLESRIQTDFIHDIRARGGLAYKLAPTAKGIPDLLVVSPEGELFLVEMKQSSGRVSPAQRVQHHRLAQRGVTIYILRSREEGDAWLREHFGRR